MVRISGPEAISIGNKLFRGRTALGARPRYVEHGHLLDAAGDRLDDGLAWVLAAPRSYTGEDTVEITAHGSNYVLEQLVEAARSHGAEGASAGEFTKRAFLNGRLDLIQAEAVIDLVQAGSRAALENSYQQASGRLSVLAHEIKARLVRTLAHVEAALDFAEEEDVTASWSASSREINSIIERSARLIGSFDNSRRRQQGHAVALVGRSNVGKSTLMNALLEEDRSIVTDTPGTTRDAIEGQAVWAGEQVRLTDTAGLRKTSNEVEAEGIVRTHRAASDADLVVAVTDVSNPWTPEDDAVVRAGSGKTTLVACNKADLEHVQLLPKAILSATPIHYVSAKTGEGVPELQKGILSALPKTASAEGAGLTRQRHVELMQRCKGACRRAHQQLEQSALPECVAADLHEALAAMGELLGEQVQEAVLDEIFSEFCIGK